MTAEWLYPPGVGPLCGAELEAWYEDLQDILGSDAGGAKHSRAPPCAEVSHTEVAPSCHLSSPLPPNVTLFLLSILRKCIRCF